MAFANVSALVWMDFHSTWGPPIASCGAPHLLDPLCQSCWDSQLGAIKSHQALSNLQCWVSWLKRWFCCLWWGKVPHLTPPFKTSRDDHSAPRNEDISLSVGWQVWHNRGVWLKWIYWVSQRGREQQLHAIMLMLVNFTAEKDQTHFYFSYYLLYETKPFGNWNGTPCLHNQLVVYSSSLGISKALACTQTKLWRWTTNCVYIYI